VTKGQELIRLDDREAEIRLKAVRSEFQIADADARLQKNDLENERDALEKKGSAASHEYQAYMKKFQLKEQRLDSELALARTKVEQAELDFARLTVCAPSDGLVDNLPLVGQTVSPDNSLIAFLPEPPREASNKE
jgi:multidrug resistance efflux pump